MTLELGFAPAMAAAAPTPSPYARFVGEGRKTITYVRVFAGDDGHARFEDVKVEAQKLGTSSNGLGQFLMRKSTVYAVFTAPANHVIPARKVLPGMPEFFYIIGGNCSVKTANATRQCETGTVLLFEDSKGSGHTVQAGPQGYTAIKILLAE